MKILYLEQFERDLFAAPECMQHIEIQIKREEVDESVLQPPYGSKEFRNDLLALGIDPDSLQTLSDSVVFPRAYLSWRNKDDATRAMKILSEIKSR